MKNSVPSIPSPATKSREVKPTASVTPKSPVPATKPARQGMRPLHGV